MKTNRIILSVALPLFALGAFAFYREQQKNIQQQVRPRRAAGQAGKTVQLKAGADLQAAIKSAEYGDTIVLQAGASYNGPLVLPNKGPGSGTDADYITIRTSDLAGISPEGSRIQPAQHARAMPKVLAPNESTAVAADDGAHHYKFIGVEFTLAPPAKYVYNLIDLGKSDYKSASQFPHHLVFDRCYVHAKGLNTARRGFALNIGHTEVLNSYVSGFAGAGDETQAIAGWNGPGPYKIINNYLEGGGEVVLFGGADPSIRDLVPSDIEIRRNYMYKPAEWNGHATIKGMFELKNARRVIIDGNVIESPIRTTALVITVRNQNGTAPWSTIEDVDITNNLIRHVSTGVNLLGRDMDPPTQTAKRIRVANNLFLDVVSSVPSDVAYFLQINRGDSITVEHNTVQQAGTIAQSELTATNFVLKNNIVQHSLYGIVCFIGGCEGANLWCKCFPGAVIKGNVIADNLNVNASENIGRKFPPGNYVVPSFDRIGFVDYARGDWRLAPNSKFRGRAEGKDPGVDFDQFKASGVESAISGQKPAGN